MDQIVEIFYKLGGDSTYGYQLALVVFVFVLAPKILFNKLQDVLDTREAKTTKLEHEAELKFSKANELSESFRAQIDIAHASAQREFNKTKIETMGLENDRFKKAEESIFEEIEKSRLNILRTVEEKQVQVFKDADSLSEELVNKIIQ